MLINGALGRALGIALLVVGAAAPPAFAEEETATNVPVLDTVTITGSRIARPELEAPAPILAITADQMHSQGLTNFAEIAAQTPQFSASFSTSRTQSTFSGAANSGLNQINLRNLNARRTLVLINGRRVPAGTTFNSAADFNTIPTANIERIDVLTGGASAVYGADAVAGAINIITKKIDGVEIGGNYSITGDHDNKSPGGYLMMGGEFGDRGHGGLTVQYENEGIVHCSDRYLCAQDVTWFTPDQFIRGPAAYSAVGANGKFQLGTSGPFYTSRNGSFKDANGALIPFSIPIDGYNRNAVRTLAIPTKRLMFASDGDYELFKGVTAFAELNFGQSKTDAPFEGNPFQSTAFGNLFGGGVGVTGLQDSIPVNNPFIPAALRAALPANATVMNWQQRFDQLGNRGATNERNTVRVLAGFKGSFESPLPAGGAWNWELSHVYGHTTLSSITDGLVRTDRLYYGLRVEADPSNPGQYRCSDPGARATGCVPINPFAPYTQAMKDYLTDAAGQHGASDLEDTNAFIGGPVFNLPAGPLSAVLGIERRSFAGFLDYDDVINKALVTGNQIADIERIKTVTREAYFETAVPILKGMKFAQDVTFDGSFRRSNPNSGDNYNTWAAGLVWEPLSGIRFRANKARAVRTPAPDELSGNAQTFGVVNDPCTASRRNQNATRAANCLADGVPATYAPPATVEQSVSGVVAGNPNLKPEQGDTLTYGVVLTPTFVENFSLSVDRFKLDLTKEINTVGRQLEANLCYDTAERLYCGNLLRGTNPNTPGNWALLAVNDKNVNIGRVIVSGFDVEAGYRFDLGHLLRSASDRGSISLHMIMTFYDQADEVPLPGNPVIHQLGYAGGSTSDQGWLKRQGVLDTTYHLGSFSANWHLRYVGRARMALGLDGFPDIGSYIYHDVRFAFDFKKDSQVYLGITNLANKRPPFFASGGSGTQALDTIPAYYDVFGRTFFGGFAVRF
jgi:outer membrane receptor protein involved in Fe transport